jgi:2-iminobutanoate/2-iminopropanoate deaminase
MERNTVSTDKAPAAIGPYSQGIAAGPWLFVSGQLGMDPQTGELVKGGLASQARQALKNLKAVVEAGGCTLADVTAVEVFLTDMGDFVEFNGIYAEYFESHKPARAAIGVAALPKGAAVEIKCIALRSEL